MTQLQKMKKALQDNVIPSLLSDGFVGKYPHYRKFYPNRIELISFPQNKYGNAFHVVASIVYPDREKQNQNVDYHFFDGNFEEITTEACGDIKYFLKGKFEGIFYYTDVYRIQIFGGLMYEGVSETKAKTYKPKRFYKLVQKSDDNIYQKVCDEVNKKIPEVYKWWAKMSQK